jgi:hypothetical protein
MDGERSVDPIDPRDWRQLISNEICWRVVADDGVRFFRYDEAGRTVAFRYEALSE